MDRFLFQTSPALLVPLENPEQRNFLLLSSHICTLFPIFPHNEKGSYNRAMIFHVLACFGHVVLGNPVSELQVARNDREWHVGGSGHTFGNSNLAVVFLNSTNSDEVLQGVFVFCCVMWARVYLMRYNYFKVFLKSALTPQDWAHPPVEGQIWRRLDWTRRADSEWLHAPIRMLGPEHRMSQEYLRITTIVTMRTKQWQWMLGGWVSDGESMFLRLRQAQMLHSQHPIFDWGMVWFYDREASENFTKKSIVDLRVKFMLYEQNFKCLEWKQWADILYI